MTLKIDEEITFRKLTIFIEFMNKGNIARTAEALGISAVSVHRALHTLEEGVRCPLFVHKGRNLVALPAARTLLEHSQKVVELMHHGLEETCLTAGVGQGQLKMGTLYSLTLETVPRLIIGMKKRRPKLELNLTMGSNQVLLNMLEDGSLDAILISISKTQINPKIFEIIPLFQDDIYLAAPASTFSNVSNEVDLREYKALKFVSLAEGFATFEGFQEACHVAGFQPDIVTRVNDIFSLLSLVQAGVGLSLVPGRMHKVYEQNLQWLKLAEPYQMRQQIAIVLAHNRERDPNLLALAAEGRMYALSRQTALH